MKKNDERNGDEFRQGMIGRKHGVLQAIDDEQANCCRRQYSAQIGNEGRRIAFGKDKERKEPGKHCSQGDSANGQQHFKGCHNHKGPSLVRYAFFFHNKIPVMSIIAGITNWLLPNIASASSVQAIPVMAERRALLCSHCPRNKTTNKAVMTKSMPVVSKRIYAPSTAPKTVLTIQYR